MQEVSDFADGRLPLGDVMPVFVDCGSWFHMAPGLVRIEILGDILKEYDRVLNMDNISGPVEGPTENEVTVHRVRDG
ncbi:protein of unknown function [Streptomyces murinus]